MPYNFIVPSIAETQITGFLLGGERTMRGAQWQVRVYAPHFELQVSKNGKRVDALADCPKSIHAMAIDLASKARFMR